MSKKKNESKKYRKKKAKRGLKRHLKATKRKEKHKNKRYNRKFRIYSKLIRYLKKNTHDIKTSQLDDSEYIFEIPKNFSLIENPDETLRKLHELVNIISDTRLKKIFIDHGSCKNLDIGASLVMDVLMIEAKRECRKKETFLKLSGKYSEDEKVNELIKVAGLIRHIKHKDSEVPDSIKRKYDVFDLVIRKDDRIESFSSTNAEIEATKLTDYFDRLLKTNGVELTIAGKKRLIDITTEVLDNAEQHSGNGTWYLFGYLDNDQVCNITMFNFGDPISKTLKEGDLRPDTRKKIEQLIASHNKRGLFDLKKKWDSDNLWTLFALQEGISRIYETDKEIDRGHGTVKLIEFFLSLSRTGGNGIKPQMVVISGNTYIQFDGKYELRKKEINGETRQIIAFNKANSLEDKPDSDYVFNVENGFPGTIISLKFHLEREYLQNIANNDSK